MLFRQMFDAETATYTYLVADEQSGEALLIDPVFTQCAKYQQLLEELDLTLLYAVDTHVHADHVTASGRLKAELEARTVMGAETQAEGVDIRLEDEDCLPLGNLTLRAIATPGHTDDSYCFYLEDGECRMVFTGDTLLIRGTGRTDFQNGDAAVQYDSLMNRLLSLPDDTLVYPGHDYKGWCVSSIGEEKAHNPRLQVTGVKEYTDLMNGLNLPEPKQMHVAVPANLRCGMAV